MPPPTPLRARPIEEAAQRLREAYGDPIPKEFEERAKETGRPVEYIIANRFAGSKGSLRHPAKEYLLAYNRLPEVKKALKEALKAAKKNQEEYDTQMSAEPHLLHSPRKGE